MRKYRKEDIAVVDEMPPLMTPFAEIRSPRYGAGVEGIVICPKILMVWTHFYGNRTIPHLEDRTECEGCKAERAKRFKGYLGIYLRGTKEYILGEVTQLACEPWKGILQDPAVSLRGAHVRIERANRSPQSRVKMEIKLGVHDVDRLPPPFDILPILLNIWSGATLTRRGSGTVLGSTPKLGG